MVEVVMTHGAKTSARAGSWRLETQREKRSRQPRGRNLFGEDLVQIKRAGMPSGNKAVRHGGINLLCVVSARAVIFAIGQLGVWK